MVMDRWLSSGVETISPEMVDEALDELEGAVKEIEGLAVIGEITGVATQD